MGIRGGQDMKQPNPPPALPEGGGASWGSVDRAVATPRQFPPLGFASLFTRQSGTTTDRRIWNLRLDLGWALASASALFAALGGI